MHFSFVVDDLCSFKCWWGTSSWPLGSTTQALTQTSFVELAKLLAEALLLSLTKPPDSGLAHEHLHAVCQSTLSFLLWTKADTHFNCTLSQAGRTKTSHAWPVGTQWNPVSPWPWLKAQWLATNKGGVSPQPGTRANKARLCRTWREAGKLASKALVQIVGFWSQALRPNQLRDLI